MRAKLCLSLLIAALSGCGEALDNRADQPYNVLLITIDTLRADRLGVYGYEAIETPNLDRLAREGACFKAAYTPCPVTLPAHTSIMTGTYPAYHGVRNNGIFSAGEELTTLAEVLRENGYFTAAVIGAYVLDKAYGLSQGFEVYDDAIASGPAKDNPFTSPERKAREITQRAYPLLKHAGDKPFFLWLHYFDPHATYNPPPPYAARYRDAPYDGEVAYVDEEIGSLLKMLAFTGRDEDTLVIVTSDHGEGLMEHGEDSHGVLLYDTTLHVPLIMANRELIPGSTEIDTQVSLVDIAPTVLDILNIDGRDQAMQGVSLVPLLKGDEEEAHKLVYYETLLPYFDFGWAGMRGVRTDALKYISAPEPELFETRKDPKEEKNRHAEMSEAASNFNRSLMIIAADLASAAAKAGGREVDPSDREKLEALGYASGALHTSIEGDPFKGPDPKSRIWVEAALNASSKLFSQGRYTEALAELDELLRQEPRNPNVLYFLAVVNAEMGRLTEAAELYKQLLEVQPMHDKAWNNLGVLYNQRGMTGEALAAFERSLEQNERRADVHYNMASIYGERGEVEKAEQALKRAVEIQPTFAKAYNNLGTLYASLGNYENAVEAFLNALAVDPRLGLSHKNCARCYYLLQDYKKAVRHLEQALKLGVEVDPELVKALKPYR